VSLAASTSGCNHCFSAGSAFLCTEHEAQKGFLPVDSGFGQSPPFSASAQSQGAARRRTRLSSEEIEKMIIGNIKMKKKLLSFG
jgi:hypothetical protein